MKKLQIKISFVEAIRELTYVIRSKDDLWDRESLVVHEQNLIRIGHDIICLSDAAPSVCRHIRENILLDYWVGSYVEPV